MKKLPTLLNTLGDITERKRAEQILYESEARFRALADAAGDKIYTIAADGEVSYVNEIAARALQTTPEQAIGKRLRDLFPPEIFERQWHDLQTVFETGEPLYVETPARFPSGEVWQGTWLTPLHDASGSVVSVLGASRDITARKQAEAKIAEQLDELKHWNAIMQEREMRIIEVKREVNELLAQAGQPPRYLSVVEPDGTIS